MDKDSSEDDDFASLVAGIVAGIVGVAMVACVIVTLLWRRPTVENAGDVQLETLVPDAKDKAAAASTDAAVARVSSSDASGDPQQEQVDLESSGSHSTSSVPLDD